MDRANSYGDAEDHVKLILSGEGHPLIDIEISSCCGYPGTTTTSTAHAAACGAASGLEWK